MDAYPSNYLFNKTPQFLTAQKKEWLENATIAHIAPLWLPLPREDRNYGGTEDVVLNNIQTLEDFGVKKQIVFGHPANKRIENIFRTVNVITPDYIPASVDLLNILRTDKAGSDNLERTFVIQAYKTIVELQKSITIVHDHTNHGRDHGIWVGKSIVPVIRTEHGPLKEPHTYPYEENYLRQFTQGIGMGLVAISKNQKSQIPNINWIGVNYNGVDLKDFTYREKKSNYLLFLGKVSKSKGPHNAIKVAKRTGIPLIIAGAVEQTQESIQYFEREIVPHIDNNLITHLEYGVNASERKDLLAKARALLMLIEWDEPFGMVMVEALVSGTPIIAYKKGSVNEIVTERTGFIVRNIKEAVSAVNLLKRNKIRPRDCRLRVEEFFSREAMTSGYIEMYMKHEKKFIRENGLRQNEPLYQ